MRTSLLLCVAWLCLGYLSLNGQATFNLRMHFDTPATYLTSIVCTDSCYYATGIYADTFPWLQVGSIFAKINLDGTIAYTRKLIHPDKSYETRMNTLTPLEDGNFVATAYSFDPEMKGMLIKYSPHGDTVWTKEYLNPFYPIQNFCAPITLQVLENEDFAMACWIQKNAGNGETYLLKTDSQGNVQQQILYSNTLWDRPYSTLLAPSGELIVGAARSNISWVNEGYTFQNHIFQIDALGNTQWTYLSPVSEGLRYGAADMVLLEDGSLVVASGIGYEQQRSSVNAIYFEKYIFKLNPQREIEWEISFPEPELTSQSRLTNLIALSDGSGYVAVGTHGEILAAQNSFSLRGWLGKISPSGDSLWTRQYVGIQNNNNLHYIYDIKETADGGYILCGESQNSNNTPGTPSQQAWLLKLDAYGCLVPGCHLSTAAEEPAQERFELRLYPNPASEYLNFYLRAPAAAGREVSFRIFDASGALLQEFAGVASDATYMVPVWDWPAGTYLLQCVGQGRVLAVEKFVKR